MYSALVKLLLHRPTGANKEVLKIVFFELPHVRRATVLSHTVWDGSTTCIIRPLATFRHEQAVASSFLVVCVNFGPDWPLLFNVHEI